MDYFVKMPNKQPRGVTVAQLVLVQLAQVRILAGLPDLSVSRTPFVDDFEHPFFLCQDVIDIGNQELPLDFKIIWILGKEPGKIGDFIDKPVHFVENDLFRVFQVPIFKHDLDTWAVEDSGSAAVGKDEVLWFLNSEKSAIFRGERCLPCCPTRIHSIAGAHGTGEATGGSSTASSATARRLPTGTDLSRLSTAGPSGLLRGTRGNSRNMR